MELLKYKIIKNGNHLIISLKRSDGFNENLEYIEIVKPLTNHNTHKSNYRKRDIKGKFTNSDLIECKKCKEIFNNKLKYEIHLIKCKAYTQNDLNKLKELEKHKNKNNI